MLNAALKKRVQVVGESEANGFEVPDRRRQPRPISGKTLDMCEMRAAGLKYREIAERLQVTPQAVEQAVKRATERDPELAERVRAAGAKPPRPPKVVQFKARMLYWLRWAGFRYCWCCMRVEEEGAFSPKARICRKCNAQRTRERYHMSPVVRENLRRHNRVNGRKYNQRYIEKLKRENPERLREIRRQAYLNQKARRSAAAGSQASEALAKHQVESVRVLPAGAA